VYLSACNILLKKGKPELCMYYLSAVLCSGFAVSISGWELPENPSAYLLLKKYKFAANAVGQYCWVAEGTYLHM
jgi:hypothetical protein